MTKECSIVGVCRPSSRTATRRWALRPCRTAPPCLTRGPFPCVATDAADRPRCRGRGGDAQGQHGALPGPAQGGPPQSRYDLFFFFLFQCCVFFFFCSVWTCLFSCVLSKAHSSLLLAQAARRSTCPKSGRTSTLRLCPSTRAASTAAPTARQSMPAATWAGAAERGHACATAAPDSRAAFASASSPLSPSAWPLLSSATRRRRLWRALSRLLPKAWLKFG